MRPPRLLAALVPLLLAAPAFAQDSSDPPQEELKPVAVLAVAGVERARDDVRYLFETVGREDMTEVVNGYLEFVGDLDGVEPTKPLGIMLFLKPGFVPVPVGVGYVPVADVQALRENISFGEAVSTEKKRDDFYEIKGMANTPSLFARIQDGYALISNEEEFLEERILPDPALYAASLAARADIAVTALPKNIPPGMRSLFQNFLRTNTQAQMQRRDEEPEAAYRVRKAQARRNLEVFEAMFEGSDAITFGVDASRERKTIEFTLDFESVPGTKWAEIMAEGRVAATPFDVLHDESLPLSVLAGSSLAEWDVVTITEQLQVAEDEIAAFLAGLRPPTGDDGEPPRQAELEANREAGLSDYDLVDPASRRLAEDVVQPLIVTAENKELDFLVQFRRERPGGFVILGAARIGQGERFAAAVPKLLERVAEVNPDVDRILTLNAEEADGVTWHEFDFANSNESVEQEIARESERQEIREELGPTAEAREEKLAEVDAEAEDDDGVAFFGGRPSFHIGLGRDAVWFALGAEDALPTAKAAVARVKEQAGRLGSPPQAPIRAAVNVTQWLPDEPEDDGAYRALEAFDPDNDRATIRFEPTPAGGGRLRVTLDEGFVRFLGLSIAEGYDESQL